MHIKERQIEIIEAAGELLTSGGLQELTTKNLAKKMNFTESAIYRHFASKEEIIITMLEYLAENMDERITNAITNKKSGIEQLNAAFEAQFRFFDANRHFLIAVFSEGLWENNKLIQKAIESVMAVKIKHFTAIFENGQKDGELRADIPAQHLVHITMASFRLQILKWRMSNFTFDLIKQGKELTASIIKLIKQ